MASLVDAYLNKILFFKENTLLTVMYAFSEQIFKKYIEIELQLANIDRCRKLYEKYLEWAPHNCYAWSKYAELEKSLGETERARSLFELAISQLELDMPELLWKVCSHISIARQKIDKTVLAWIWIICFYDVSYI